MSFTDEQKAFVREVAKEAMRGVVSDHEVRIRECEKVLFNGIKGKVKALFWILGIILTTLIANSIFARISM